MAVVPNPFAVPAEFSNVALIVDGKKLHVSKEYLAAHSSFFAAMFFGDFVEKGKEEVEIKDVEYEEFLYLLNVIHPGFTPITAASVSFILKLADQFQMKDARDQAVLFLLHTIKVTIDKKLSLADQYNLHTLRDYCLKSFTCVFGLRVIQSSSECKNLSDATKIAMCDRMMELLSVDGARSGHTNHAYCRCGIVAPVGEIEYVIY